MRLTALGAALATAATATAALATAALATATPATASVAPATATVTQSPATLSGSCSFSGPITPKPPITAVPKPGPHFDYAGKGTCDGTFDGVTVAKAPITVIFKNAGTLFDTCELGPDVDLNGTLTIISGKRKANFAITIDMARAAVAGPFALTTQPSGRAAGTATFTPPSTTGSLSQCAGSGVGTATLAGSFHTLQDLNGTNVPPPRPRRRARPRHHSRHRRPSHPRQRS